MRDFLFVNLVSQQSGAKPFDGMAAGTFTDMRGVKAEFKPEELAEYVGNTKVSILSTTGADGQPVGLPIDPRGHYHDEDAAGWIVNVELSESGDKVIFYPRWTALGQDLIGNDLQRFFSPTIDLKNKVIMGGSLTNWPATRSQKGEILLKPLELSMSEQTVQLDMEEDMSILEKFMAWVKELLADKNGETEPEPAAEPAPEEPMVEASLSAPDPAPVVELTAEQLDMIEQRAEARAAELLTIKERENQVMSFSREVVGKGLPVEADKLAAFLAPLSDEQLETARGIFSRVADTGLIPLTELGHSQVMTGTKPLPELIAGSLKTWITNKGDIAEFFKVNAVELGNQSDYDLSEYAPKEG